MHVNIGDEIRNRKGEILKLKKEIETLEAAMVVLGADKPGPAQEETTPSDDDDDT